MNQKVFKTMIGVLIVITVVGAGTLVFLLTMQGKGEDGQPSIDEIVENSLETEEITTDLKDEGFVRIQFRIVTNSKDAKEELQKRDFQLKNILIKELSNMNQQDLSEVDNLENMLKTRLNELMMEGKVTDVYTTNKVLQN